MRFVKMNNPDNPKGNEDPNGAIRFSTNNITYKGRPLTEFMEKVLLVEEVEGSPSISSFKMDSINDEIVDPEHGWSSEKITKELKKINDRVSSILTFGKEDEVNTKELLDLRIDFEGKLHPTVGEAVRDQVVDLHKKIETDVIEKVNNGSNEYGQEKSIISSGAIVAMKHTIIGNNTNMYQIPSLDGYILMNAVNADVKRCNFFVAGVGNDADHAYIYLNRVVTSTESASIVATYVRINT